MSCDVLVSTLLFVFHLIYYPRGGSMFVRLLFFDNPKRIHFTVIIPLSNMNIIIITIFSTLYNVEPVMSICIRHCHLLNFHLLQMNEILLYEYYLHIHVLATNWVTNYQRRHKTMMYCMCILIQHIFVWLKRTFLTVCGVSSLVE